MLGTVDTSVVLPGLQNNAAFARQLGPRALVTTDAQGNLASDQGRLIERVLENGQGAAMAIAIAVLHVRAGRSSTPKGLAIGVAVLAVVIGVATTVQVARIGHVGTEAKWGVVSD